MGAVGGLVGGIIGNEQARGDRGQANNDMIDANTIIQNLQNAPDASRPILLEKYRQQGLLTPQMEAAISAGPSAMEGVKTNGQGIEAQQQALKAMQDRAATGMTATDRAALAKAQSQSGAAENAKQQQIMQKFKEMGQGSGSQALAAQLQAAQGGANEQSQNALDIMGRSQQQALQAAAQAGGMGSQLESQQFGEGAQKAQAADQMQRFNIQNQIGAQQRNVGAQNQAQAGNLANSQSLSNANVSNQNQEYNRQRQGEQQNYTNQLNLAGLKSGSLKGQAGYLQNQGDRTAQASKDIGTGLGGMFESAAGFFSQGGQVHDYKNGGHVQGQANVPGDSPENDTVDAKLSPGEIVVPRSLAKSELGDKLLSLLNAHHEIKTHLDKAEGKAKKAKEKVNQPPMNPMGYGSGGMVGGPAQEFADGTPDGPVQAPVQQMSPGLPPINNVDGVPVGPDGYPIGIPDTVKSNFTPQEAIQHAKARMKFRPATPPPAPSPSLAESAATFFPRMVGQQEGKPAMSNGGSVPEKGSIEYLKHLMEQYKNPSKKKNYADGTYDGPVSADDQEAPVEPKRIPVDFEEGSLITGQIPHKPVQPMDNQPASEADLMEPQNPEDKQLENQYANEDFEANEAADKAPEKVAKKDEKSKDEDKQDQYEERDVASDDEESNKEDASPAESPKEEGQSEESVPNKLDEAQKKRRIRSTLAEMARFGDLAGAGIAKANAAPAGYFDSLSKAANLPVQEYQEQVANQPNDPKSTMSQVVRDYLTSKGIKVPDNSSAADLYKVAPFLAKDQALQVQLQKLNQTNDMKKQKQAEDLQFKYDKLQSDHEMRLANAKDKKERDAINNEFKQQMIDIRKEMVNLSGSRLGLSATSKIEQDPTVKKANDRINSAESALTQLNDKSQPLTMNRLNAIQIDLANTLNFMSSQGASDYKAKSDKLENLNTMIAAAKQKYGSSLVDLRKEAPEVYKEVTAYAKSVRDSVKQIKDKQEKNLKDKYTTSIGEDSTASKRINKAYDQGNSAAGKHKPGDVVTVKGKQYKVGADGDSLEEM